MNTQHLQTDFLVIGGGTAGTMAGIKAKQANPDADVLILEKANIRRSGAIAMGMDGVNTAVIPGNSTPEQYVREITTEYIEINLEDNGFLIPRIQFFYIVQDRHQ